MLVEAILLLLDTQVMVVVKGVGLMELTVDLMLGQLVVLVEVVLLVMLILNQQVVRVTKVALTLLKEMTELLANGTL
jgi:hypothetical protein